MTRFGAVMHTLNADDLRKLIFDDILPVARCEHSWEHGVATFLFVGDSVIAKLRALVAGGVEQLQVGSLCSISNPESECITWVVGSPGSISHG